MSEKWSYEQEWFEETRVAKKIKKHLENEGWKIIKFNENKRQRGPDIEAIRNEEKLVVEVKGYPSDKYVSGEKKGKKKPTNPKLQAKHWFAEALFSLIREKSKDQRINVALGLPDFERYRELIDEINFFKEKFGLVCYLVDKNGSVLVF